MISKEVHRDTPLTEKWLRDRLLILKKSDRVDPNVIWIYDTVPLNVRDSRFYFEWSDGRETEIRYVEHLQVLYYALTYTEFPTTIYKKGIAVYEAAK